MPRQPVDEKKLDTISSAISSFIDLKNEVTLDSADIPNTIEELEEKRDEIKEDYIQRTIEREVDNFVANNSEEVVKALTGTLDEKVSELNSFHEYLNRTFGDYQYKQNFSREELLWMLAQEIPHHYDSQHNSYEVTIQENVDLESVGEVPDIWSPSEEFPQINRNIDHGF